MNSDQIVALYEESGLSVEEISEAASLEIEAVKLALASKSKAFAKEYQKNEDIFSKDEFDAAKLIMGNLLYADNESVRFRAAKFIVNEKLGRNDIKELNNVSLNVTNINLQLKKAKEAIEKGRNKIIEISPNLKELAS